VAARIDSLLAEPEDQRIPTGMAGVDRVLGGGLVPGSVVLLAGAPGIGKSTLLLQLASRLSTAGQPCLIASGEESLRQVGARAGRLGLDRGEAMRFVPGRDLGEVVAAAGALRPAVLAVDSIQTIRDPDATGLPGGTAQVRGCADALVGLAKEQGVTILLAGHVTKDGDLAGPRALEHVVDVVLTFEGDPRSGLRVLCGGKNRFGPEGEMAWFEMGQAGLAEHPQGPLLRGSESEPGSATAVALAGRRAFAIDVQALVVPTDGPARRQVAGLDPRRFHLTAAVADRVAGVRLVRSELYGATAGGLRLDDPGADLAVAAALASSATGVAVPAGWAFIGEVSLTGAIRPVPGMDQRLAAAAGAGITRVMCAPGKRLEGSVGGRVMIAGAGHLRAALAWAIGPARVPVGAARRGRSRGGNGR
jgi:DNA repair protein RadA/Sms